MPPEESPVQVVKVGGSLLDWPETPSRLADLLSAPNVFRPLLIVGGGLTADIVRNWHQAHRFDEDTAHALAIDAMAFNTGLLLTVLPQTILVSTRDEAVSAWNNGGWPILDCATFLPGEEAIQPHSLPHSWQSTSDAIAAWVTLAWPASGLLLLKSIGLPEDQPASRLAAAGLIDECLAGWLDDIPAVDWINLRAATPQATRWHNRADQPAL